MGLEGFDMTPTKHAPDEQDNTSRALPPYLYSRRVRQVLGFGQQHRNADYRRAVGLTVTRPSLGQISGWIVFVAGSLVMGALYALAF